MAKQKWKGAALLSPNPAVIVSCGNDEKANLITIGWTGIVCSHPPKLYISVRPERYSYEIIKQTREFCVNLTTSDMARAVDFCGVRSGRDTDKFLECKFTKEPCFDISCPRIAESPVNLECRVTDIINLGSHDMFIADILSVAADTDILDEKGRLMLERANLLSYSHGDYFSCGKKLGDFGFSVRKKNTAKRRNGKAL